MVLPFEELYLMENAIRKIGNFPTPSEMAFHGSGSVNVRSTAMRRGVGWCWVVSPFVPGHGTPYTHRLSF